MRYLKIITAVLLVFLVSCSKSTGKTGEETTTLEESTKVIDLQPVKEKSVSIDSLITPMLFMDRDQLHVYGLEAKLKKEYDLLTYDTALNLKGQNRFNTGEAPGELGEYPRFFSTGDQFIASDHSQMRISFFDKDFKFIKFIKMQLPYRFAIFDKNGKYLIYEGSNDIGVSNITTMYLCKLPNMERIQIHSFPPIRYKDVYPEEKTIVKGIGGVHYFLKDNRIYLLDKTNYIVTIRDITGKMIKQVRMDFKKIPTPQDKVEEWMEEYKPNHRALLKRGYKLKFTDYIQPCSWMIPLEKGFIVLRRSGFSMECRGMVNADYFDFDLHLLGKVKFPCFDQMFNVSKYLYLKQCEVKNGYLYLLARSETEDDVIFDLEKWKITE